jgi:hypothetical protein
MKTAKKEVRAKRCEFNKTLKGRIAHFFEGGKRISGEIIDVVDSETFLLKIGKEERKVDIFDIMGTE